MRREGRRGDLLLASETVTSHLLAVVAVSPSAVATHILFAFLANAADTWGEGDGVRLRRWSSVLLLGAGGHCNCGGSRSLLLDNSSHHLHCR